MSDLADAVFDGQLLGHIIASVITDAAMTADLASHMALDDNLSPLQHAILQAKVAEHTIAHGGYDSVDILNDMQSSNHADGIFS